MTTTNSSPTIVLIYDVKLRRPACALLQAALGADHSWLGSLFDASTWLTAPTPDMRRLRGTRDEWERAAAMGGTTPKKRATRTKAQKRF